MEKLLKLAVSVPDAPPETPPLPPSIPATMTEEGDRVILSANISFKPRRGRSEIIDRKTCKAITACSTSPNPILIQTIAQAEFWRSELLLQPEKSLESITVEYGVKPRYIRRLLNAAYLAPAIKRAVFQGIHPAHLQVQDHCADEGQLKTKLEARAKALAEWREKAVAEEVKAERDDLLKIKSAAAEAQQSLAKFVVERARFYYSEGRFSSDPVIDLTVRNGTGQTVSRFYAHGVLSSPGRETPWIDKEFNYSIRGGMQSGEVQNLEPAPNRFTEWGKAPKDKNDMVLTVTIKRINGADGKKLFEAEFSEKSAARLAALEKIIASQGGK